jgi:AmiR/NasT family two-component response regulator
MLTWMSGFKMGKILELDKFKELKSLAKSKSVLVITNSDIVYVRIHSILKHFFDVIDFVENSSEAMENYLKYNYEFIIIDVEDNKTEITEKFAFINEVKFITKNQSIIITSQNSSKDFLVRIINHDISGFIEQPIDPRMILYRLSVILEEKRMAELYPTLNQKKRDAQNITRLRFPTKLLDDSNKDKPASQKTIDRKVDIHEFLKTLKHTNFDSWNRFESIDKALEELVVSMEESIYLIVDGNVNDDVLVKLSKDFSQLYQEISTFEAFKNIADEIYEVNNIFLDNYSNGASDLNENQNKALLFMEYLFEDIKAFVNAIFIKQNAENIDIFYPQIKSGVEQINAIINKSEDTDDDLDFF